MSPHFQGPKYAGECQRSPSLECLNRLQPRLLRTSIERDIERQLASVLLEEDCLGALALSRIQSSKAMNQK